MNAYFELDDVAELYLASIGRQEGRIYDACEQVRSDIGSLVGHTLPFDHNGHIQLGEVIAVLGFGRDYDIQVRNCKTGVTRRVSTFSVFEALRRLEETQE